MKPADRHGPTRRRLLWGALVVIIAVTAQVYYRDLNRNRAMAAGLDLQIPLTEALPVQRVAREALAVVAQPEPGSVSASPSERSALIQTHRLERQELADTERTTILKCVGGFDGLAGVQSIDDFRSLDEYIRKAPTRDLSDQQIRYRNIHFLTDDGTKLRLRLTPKEGGGGLDAKIFGVDEEDLPIPMVMPEDLKNLSLRELVKRMQSQGHIESDEMAESRRWGPKLAGSMQKKNGHVVQLQIFFSGRSLACGQNQDGRGIHCVCLGQR